VIFSGGHHLASTTLGPVFNGVNPALSVLAVIRAASDLDGAVATWERTANDSTFLRARVSDGGPFLRFQTRNDAGGSFQNDENALLSLTTGNVVAWSTNGTTSFLNTDGNAQDSAAINLGTVTTQVFRMGASLTDADILFNGRIAELFVIGRAVTPAEYTAFRDYARVRWAGLP
jgi:hypothetical protein